MGKKGPRFNFEVKEINNELTPTEVKVLDLINKGLGRADVANHLGMSVRTYDGHRKNIIKKGIVI